jgi:hypothetical protein
MFFLQDRKFTWIDCLNCENVIVANHGCSFLMFISDQDLPDSEPRRLQGTTTGTTWKHTITKCGRHLLSFKPEHSNNAIKLVDSENNEISERGIKVFVEVGPADHLVFKTPALEAQLGVKIPAFEIDVLDKFGNPVPKEDVSTILWQFVSGDDCDLHKDYKIVPGDGHVSVTQLRVSKASLPESVSEKKTFKVVLQGKKVENAPFQLKGEFVIELTHGSPSSLELEVKGVTPTIKCDSSLPKISVSVLDDSRNLCNTATGWLIAFSDKVVYDADDRELCVLPLDKGKQGKVSFGGRNTDRVQGIIFKDALAENANEHPVDRTLELDLQARQQAQTRLYETKDHLFLVHFSLGVFMKGDFVLCDISDRDRVHPSKIAHSVPVLARIDKLECASASEQRVGQGRSGLSKYRLRDNTRDCIRFDLRER